MSSKWREWVNVGAHTTSLFVSSKGMDTGIPALQPARETLTRQYSDTLALLPFNPQGRH